MGEDTDEESARDAKRTPGGSGGGRTALWLAVAVAVAHAASLWGTGPVDDDYIVYRYARNWLAGDGLAFNAGGPSVEGATSPLWFAVVALGVRLGAAPEVWSPLLGVLASAVSTYAVGACAMRLGGSRGALLAPWLVALSPAVAWHANAGLGTVPLAAAIAVGVERWSAWTLTGRRACLAGGAVALAVACALRAEAALVWLGWLVLARPPARPEGPAAGGTRGADLAWRALPGAVLLGVTAWRWWAFGTLLPHAFHVKSLPLAAELEYGARYLIRAGSEGGLPFLLLSGALGTRTARAGRAIGALSLVALVQVLLVGGDWIVYGRFLVPYVALAALSAALVVDQLGARASAARLAAAIALGVTLLGIDARPQAAFESRFFEDWWRTAGDAFRERAPEGASVALSPIGAFGWRSGAPIVDVLGLTHGELLGRAPDLEFVGVKGHHRHDGAWVLDQAPDYLILGNGVIQPQSGRLDVNPWERGILIDPRFERDYSAAEIELEREGGARQTLPYFVRRGAAPLRWSR
ncbi:MAG: hypothetical protein AAGB93_11805 [Planctomycetota bacterium]